MSGSDWCLFVFRLSTSFASLNSLSTSKSVPNPLSMRRSRATHIRPYSDLDLPQPATHLILSAPRATRSNDQMCCSGALTIPLLQHQPNTLLRVCPALSLRPCSRQRNPMPARQSASQAYTPSSTGARITSEPHLHTSGSPAPQVRAANPPVCTRALPAKLASPLHRQVLNVADIAACAFTAFLGIFQFRILFHSAIRSIRSFHSCCRGSRRACRSDAGDRPVTCQ
jgi:hypothetical protein